MVAKDDDEHELKNVCDDIRRRQRFQPKPKPLADLISALMSRRGYAQVQADEIRLAAWREAAGRRLGQSSRPGNLRAGVLEVFAKNSAVLQELTFRKRQLLRQFKQLAPDQKVEDLRFRIGALD